MFRIKKNIFSYIYWSRIYCFKACRRCSLNRNNLHFIFYSKDRIQQSANIKEFMMIYMNKDTTFVR